ncbi:hypothetical protein [uncultured Gimesia sp.]
MDDKHVGTVFMNRDGVQFLKVPLKRLDRGCCPVDPLFCFIDSMSQA